MRKSKPSTADIQSTKTLVVSNLLDVDQQTIYLWIKSLLNVWPLSIQFSVDEERAIVKVPAHCHIDNNKLREAVDNPGFYLRGEKLTVQELPSITNIQVTCSNQQAGNTIDPFTLESYFSNPKYTGVKDHSAVANVKPLTTYNNLPVFVVSYGSAEDVECVLKRSSYQLSRWSLAVAGFYPEVGMCNPDSLCTYPAERNHSKEKGDKKKQPILHINNIDEGKVDIDTLELLMSHRRRSDGGEIESWKRFPGKTTGMASVQVIYKESGVAERVYELYKRNGLTSHGINLELELELPWLGPDHDDRNVGVSGLNDDLDPEELKFYLSALSENVVTEMFFNKSQTRAVAMFQDPIDYGRLIDQHHSISMKDLAQLQIQQECKIKDLIATGDKLTKEDIELPLENLLHSKFNRDVDVHADKLTDSVDMWKITTEPDALQYILKQKHRLTRCETLAPYSVFLGLHVTSGVHKKSQNMDNFVSDPLMLHFLLNVQSGLQKLAGFLQTLGMILAKDGGITIDQVATTKNDRTVLKNWRKLKPTVEKFVEESFATYKTEPLTQQVFDRLSPEMPKLIKGQPVVTDMNAGSQPSANTGNQIRIAGEKGVVMTLAKQLEEMIKKFQAQIQEEKTVTRVTVPNINEYQIQYLEMIGFFKMMVDTHKLKSFDGNVSKQNVTIHGRPTSIDAVQKEMFDFLPKVTNSKVSVKKKPLFLNVFKTKSAEQTIKQQLKIKKISAIWYLENKTISVYSGSKADSQSALDAIDSVVWDSQYPAKGKLDDLEKKLVQSDVWDAKKAEMQRLYQPLEVIEMEDHSTVGLSGLMQVKAVVIENMKMFFTQNVKRPGKFEGIPDRVLFLRKYRNHLFKELEKAHNVEIDSSGDKAIIPMIGTTDDVANCCRSLKRQHDAICKDLMALEHQAMIRHVEIEPEFLDNIGLKTSCLVVEHKDEQAVLATPDDSNAEVGNRFSVTLPSGTICKVRRDDMTVLGGDAIVNSTNGDLKHVGGLALTVVKKGGNRIQLECADHIRRNGALMEGQAFTSTAGRLNCKKVIHAVGPKWRGGQFQEERKLLMCIDNCFEEADKNKFKSIAIPPVSTGIFEYPLEKAVKTIVDAVHDREKQGDYLPEYITFVDNKEDSLKLFAEYLEQLFPSTRPDPVPMPLPQQQQQQKQQQQADDDGDISDSASDSKPTEKKVLNLDIYGSTQADIAQCRNELTNKLQKQLHTMLWNDKPCYHEDRNFIQKLSAIQVAKLQRAADKLGVKLDIDQRLCNIKIVGLSKDVYAMSETTSNVFKVIQNEEQQQQQLLLAKVVQWTYGDERGQLTNFTPAANKALEDAFDAGHKANVECSTKTGKVVLDLEEMTGVDGAGLTFRIERNSLQALGETNEVLAASNKQINELAQAMAASSKQIEELVEKDKQQTQAMTASSKQTAELVEKDKQQTQALGETNEVLAASNKQINELAQAMAASGKQIEELVEKNKQQTQVNAEEMRELKGQNDRFSARCTEFEERNKHLEQEVEKLTDAVTAGNKKTEELVVKSGLLKEENHDQAMAYIRMTNDMAEQQRLRERESNQQFQEMARMAARQEEMQRLIDHLEIYIQTPFLTDATGDQELEELD